MKVLRLRYFLVLLFILGTAGWAAGGVIPEMRECMRSHTTPTEYEAVIKKYADPGIIRQAICLLVIKEPYVVDDFIARLAFLASWREKLKDRNRPWLKG